MKKHLTVLIILGFLVMTINPTAAANKYGSKAYGMGGAFSAVADDASAVYWNPAALTQNSLAGTVISAGAQIDRDAIDDITDFIDDVEGLSNNPTASELDNLTLPEDTTATVDFITAANFGNFGVAGIMNDKFSFDGREKTYNDGVTTYQLPSGTATNDLTGQGILGWGTKVIDPPVVGSLSLGLSGKYLYARHDEAKTTVDDTNDDLTTEYTDKTDNGLGADVGALATLTDTDILNVKAAATMKNLFNTMDLEPAALERTTTLGAGATFKFPLIEAFAARVAADLEMPEDSANISRFGVEGKIGSFSVRAGTYDSDGLEDTVYTGGIGFNLPLVDFNLALDSEDYISASGTINF